VTAQRAAQQRAAARRRRAAQIAAERATGKYEYAAALVALRQGNYRKAIELFKVVIKDYPNGPYVQNSQQKLSEIETLASQRLSPVDGLLQEEKYNDAILLLREVRLVFAGSTASETAERRLDELMKSPELAEAIKRAQAEDLLTEAQAYMEAADLVRCVAAYTKLSEQFADTPQGKAAQEQLKCFAADKEFQKQLQLAQSDATCRGLLSLARSYRTNKLYEIAQTKYQEIVDNYPDSEYSDQAQDDLKALQTEMAEAGY